MDIILQGVQGETCYINEVLVTEKMQEEHMRNLEIVLQRFKQYGVKIRKEQCHFLRPVVEFLCHQNDAEGRHPLADKLRALPKLLH